MTGNSVDDQHFPWCPRDDPEFRRLNNPVCICDALQEAMRCATADERERIEAALLGLPTHVYRSGHGSARVSVILSQVLDAVRGPS